MNVTVCALQCNQPQETCSRLVARSRTFGSLGCSARASGSFTRPLSRSDGQVTAAALLVCVEDFSRCRECHRERDAGSDLCVGCRGRVLTAICHYREYLEASASVAAVRSCAASDASGPLPSFFRASVASWASAATFGTQYDGSW